MKLWLCLLDSSIDFMKKYSDMSQQKSAADAEDAVQVDGEDETSKKLKVTDELR